MKFSLKKILYYGFIIFLIWIVYKMFFKKYVEGMKTNASCNTYDNQQSCVKSGCKWNDKNNKCM